MPPGFIAVPPEPPRLHVFEPDFAAKDFTLLANFEQDRVRLIKGLCVANDLESVGGQRTAYVRLHDLTYSGSFE